MKSVSKYFTCLALILSVLCSRPEALANPAEDSDPGPDEGPAVESEFVPTPVGGLLLTVSLSDPDKRLVRVSWKNVSEESFIINTAGRMKDDAENPVKHPDFMVRGLGFSWANLRGFLEWEEEATDLAYAVQRDAEGVVPEVILAVVDRVESVRLDPADEVSAVFDLRKLFDERPGKGAESAKIWFTYKAAGPADYSFWNGTVESNRLLIHRDPP